MTLNDEGPNRDLLDWQFESASEASSGAFAPEQPLVPEEARALDSLLGGEEAPPAKVWRTLQAQLRREGIIR